MGIYGGWRRGGLGDISFMGSSLVLYAIPEFVLGILFLLLFGSRFGLVPDRGVPDPRRATTRVSRMSRTS